MRARHAIESAGTAYEAVRDLNRATLWPPEMTPADIDDVLSSLCAMSAALPQAFAHLSRILEKVLTEELLVMDEMTDVRDPVVAVRGAQHDLEEARELAVDLHKLLDRAHNMTAHVISHGTT